MSQVASCLPRGRTLFHYFPDRYALMLLAWTLQRGPRRIRELRQTRLGALLRKPVVRPALAAASDGVLRLEHVAGLWPAQPQAYHLTFCVWGDQRRWQPSWNQTSRPGVNLVLQLDFNRSHDRQLRRLLGRRADFNFPGHPISERYNTLAWSRLDIDPYLGEALIEEIQSDWVRNARADLGLVRKLRVPQARQELVERWFGEGVRLADAERYVEEVLAPHARVWDEVMLAATLWLLIDVLEVRRIWMHTPEGGCRMKGMSRPPRSIYSRLPSRFAFRRSGRAPRFLQECDHRRVRKNLAAEPMWRVLKV